MSIRGLRKKFFEGVDLVKPYFANVVDIAFDQHWLEILNCSNQITLRAEICQSWMMNMHTSMIPRT